MATKAKATAACDGCEEAAEDPEACNDCGQRMVDKLQETLDDLAPETVNEQGEVTKDRWWTKTFWIIVFWLIFMPLGLVFAWMGDWSPKAKKIFTAVTVVLICLDVMAICLA